MLLFHMFEGLTKPIYLPVFQTAGSIERAVHLCEEKGQAFRSVGNEPDNVPQVPTGQSQG